jgi:hypothetical protein
MQYSNSNLRLLSCLFALISCHRGTVLASLPCYGPVATSFALQQFLNTSAQFWILGFTLTLGMSLCVPKATAREPGVYAVQVPMYRFEDYERRHFIEYCSAFLLAPKIGDVRLVSAWHCIDGWEPTWEPIRIFLDDEVVEGRIKDSGGSMQDDWLIIALSDVTLPESNAIAVASVSPRRGEKLIAVGFGPQDIQGQRYQRSVECTVESVTTTINAECQMMKGDSGGLLARQTSDGLQALGIVSSKSASSSTRFTPITKVLSGLDR